MFCVCKIKKTQKDSPTTIKIKEDLTRFGLSTDAPIRDLKTMLSIATRMEEPKKILSNVSFLSTIISSSLQNCYIHPVRFEMVFKELDINKERVFDLLFNDSDFYDVAYATSEHANDSPQNSNAKTLVQIVQDLTWDTPILDGIKKLRIFTHQTGNTVKGGGCADLDLSKEDFSYTIKRKKGLTLRDLTEVVYRMKGSKYDWLYESFEMIDEENRDDSKIVIRADFEYTEIYEEDIDEEEENDEN